MSTAVEEGHEQSTNAEECLERKDFTGAIKAYYAAADAYLRAINDVSDPEVVKTLKLLYTNHTRQAREVERRAAKASRDRSDAVLAPNSPEDACEDHPDKSEQPLQSPVEQLEMATSSISTTSTLTSTNDGPAADLKQQPEKEQEQRPRVKTFESAAGGDFENFWDNVEALARRISEEEFIVPATPHNTTSTTITDDDDYDQDDHNDEDQVRSNQFQLQSDLRMGTSRVMYQTISTSAVRIDHHRSSSASASGLKVQMPPVKSVEEYREENENLKRIVDQLTLRLSEVEKENQLLRRALLRLKDKMK